MAPLPESGRLDATPLPRLLLDIRRERWSGALVLSRDRTTKRILVHKGVPVFAESNLASESLGVQLLDEGKISRESYSEVVSRVQERKCKEGAALLELDLLGPRELFLALKEQVRRRIVDCFGWTDGEFHLEDDEAPPDDAQAFRTDMLRVVQDGLETHWSPDRTLAELASRLGQYAAPTKHFERTRKRIRADADVEQLFAALDGNCTLGEAIQRAPSPRGYAAAFLLDATGSLEYRDAPPGQEEPAAPRQVEIVFGPAGGEASPVVPAAPREASAPEGRQPAASIESLRTEVLDRHRKIGDLDHYGMLGVARDANATAIRRAYFAAAKRYHPDALASLGLEDVRREANEVFARVAKAYAILSDPPRRRDYDAELGGAVQGDADRLANAESLYRKGEILLRKGDFGGALQYLGPTVVLWPDDATYRSALGWALFKKAPPDPKAAREHLEHAVALDEHDAGAWFRLGAVLRDFGEKRAAEEAIARARKIDPEADGR